jgi:hypothetical protein
MYLRLLTAIAFAIPHLSCATTSTWEAFDYKNCRHWQITNDFQGYGHSFEKAEQIARQYASKGQAWPVLVGGRLFEDVEDQYGVCRTYAGSITCKSDTEFPLAGATFIEVKRQTFRCKNGCERVPFMVLYEMPYEDGSYSAEWAPAARKFEAECHEQHRRKKFFERLNKSR